MVKIKSWLLKILLASIAAAVILVMLGSIIIGMAFWISAFVSFLLLCWLAEKVPEPSSKSKPTD